jgi:hypothetical protein
MAFELQQGDECVISGDFLFKGEPAFTRGDIVKIEGISPEKDQPGYKYVVHSESLGRVVRLPGAVLKRISCPRCRQRLAETRLGKFAACGCGWSDLESGSLRADMKVIEANPQKSLNGSNGSASAEKPRIAYVLKAITVEGLVAFKEGEYVKVEAESPDPARPHYKYVVTSAALKEKFLLSDEDIRF